MLHGVANPTTNDLYLIIGLITCFTMTSITFFDMYEYPVIHVYMAVATFGLGAFEALMYNYQMQKHKDMIPDKDQPMVSRLNILSKVYFLTTLAMAIFLALYGTSYFVGVYLEWATLFLTLNYYSFLNFNNPYFSSITEPGTLVSASKDIR